MWTCLWQHRVAVVVAVAVAVARVVAVGRGGGLHSTTRFWHIYHIVISSKEVTCCIAVYSWVSLILIVWILALLLRVVALKEKVRSRILVATVSKETSRLVCKGVGPLASVVSMLQYLPWMFDKTHGLDFEGWMRPHFARWHSQFCGGFGHKLLRRCIGGWGSSKKVELGAKFGFDVYLWVIWFIIYN